MFKGKDTIMAYPFVLASLFYVPEAAYFPTQVFETSRVCDQVEDLVASERVTTRHLRNLECASECGMNSSCVGFVYDGSNSCHLMKGRNHSWGVSLCPGNTFANVFRKMCQNGQPFSQSDEVVCHCSDGWIGHFCETRATSCGDLVGFGYKLEEIIWATINYRSKLTKMACYRGNRYYSIGMFKNTGVHNHGLSWSQYRDGYFIDEDNYWLGLENLHTLTSSGEELIYVKGTIRFGLDGESFYVTGFRVRNESLGYSYFYDQFKYFDGYVPSFPIGDFLNDTQGVPFSTWDNDNDLDPDHNCAQLASTGWWFKTCNSTSVANNPLGMSVMTLPPPAQPAHIALDGLDLVYSNYSRYFDNLRMTVVFRVTD